MPHHCQHLHWSHLRFSHDPQIFSNYVLIVTHSFHKAVAKSTTTKLSQLWAWLSSKQILSVVLRKHLQVQVELTWLKFWVNSEWLLYFCGWQESLESSASPGWQSVPAGLLIHYQILISTQNWDAAAHNLSLSCMTKILGTRWKYTGFPM